MKNLVCGQGFLFILFVITDHLNSMKKIILIGLSIIILAIAFASWKIFGPSVKDPGEKYFYIRTGESYSDVKNELSAKGIASGFWFDLVSKKMKFDRSVKAGRYEIKKGMSLVKLIRTLRNGIQSPVNLVITKLRTKEDLAKRTGSVFEFDSLQMIRFLTNDDSLAHFGLDSNTLMTAVFPNTYSYFWNTEPHKVFQKLVNESEKFWNEARKQKAKEHGLSTKEAYILASIIEEETNKKSDKGNIASVYLNRIKIGMPLQADPTVKFAMKDFGLRRIYHKHLTYSSPYNTYQNAGLPPGPICTPSVETIDELLNSPKTNYLYFVASSKFDGSSVFASTLTDHLKNASAYQKALNAYEAARKKE